MNAKQRRERCLNVIRYEIEDVRKARESKADDFRDGLARGGLSGALFVATMLEIITEAEAEAFREQAEQAKQ